MPSLLCMENITGVEETHVKGFKCIKISTNIRDNRDHILRAEVSRGAAFVVQFIIVLSVNWYLSNYHMFRALKVVLRAHVVLIEI